MAALSGLLLAGSLLNTSSFINSPCVAATSRSRSAASLAAADEPLMYRRSTSLRPITSGAVCVLYYASLSWLFSYLFKARRYTVNLLFGQMLVNVNK